MKKVRALYHFLDIKACRNRMKGDVFQAPNDIAEELIKAGLVELLEPKKVEVKEEKTTTKTKKDKK